MTRYGIGAPGRLLVVRMEPGEDLLISLHRVIDQVEIDSAVIVSGVASLHVATLRNITSYPERWPITEKNRRVARFEEPLEVVALQGNAARSPDGRLTIHCHACLSRGRLPGETVSGHLVEGTLVATTCEVALIEIAGVEVRRTYDPATATDELAYSPAHVLRRQ